MSKRRSRRLRKKLRVGEFQELGFSVATRFRKPLSAAAEEAFLDAFLTQAIEARNLAYGGSAEGGFITRFGRGSLTETDRQAVLDWLRGRKEVQGAEAGDLIDAWYEDDESDTEA